MIPLPEPAVPSEALSVAPAPTPALALAPARPHAVPAPAAERLESIDALRGVALVLMALDHAAYFTGTNVSAETYSGHVLNLSAWPHVVIGLATNLAAPTFWVLAGVSVALLSERRRARGETQASITQFLVLRATLLVLLDLGLCTLLWQMGPDPSANYGLDVLTSLGVSLMFLCGLRLLPSRALWALALGALAGYPALLAALPESVRGSNSPWIAFLITFSNTSFPRAWFPVLAWIGLMLLGFLLGPRLTREGARRPVPWAGAGAALLAVWALIRCTGVYGTFTPMQAGEPWYRAFIMSKGPPGLDYLAFNLGLGCFVFAWLNRRRTPMRTAPVSWLVACGQASLFFYVAHLAIYRAIGPAAVSWGRHLHVLVRYGIAWIVGLALVMPLCRAYRTLRRRHAGILQLF